MSNSHIVRRSLFTPSLRPLVALAAIFVIAALSMVSTREAESQPIGTVPVTVTITEFEEIEDPDPALFQGNGDYYAVVRETRTGEMQSNRDDFIQGPDPDEADYTIRPDWEFTFHLDQKDPDGNISGCVLETFQFVIEIWDVDPDIAAPDDQMDLSQTDGTLADVTEFHVWDDAAQGVTREREGDGDTEHTGLFEGGEIGRVEFSITGGFFDTDGDGIPDVWEENGADTDCDGTIDVPLHDWGADPMHKDLFVEMDWDAGNPPPRSEILRLKEAFSKAPVDAGGTPNPDGQPGINLWIDTGSLMEGNELVGDDLGGGNVFVQVGLCRMSTDDDGNGETDFYEVKDDNFDPLRAPIFRYAVSAVGCANSPGGQGEQGGNDFVVYTTGENFSPTFMHELGHNLDLRHGGFEQDKECKPNYISIMNYDHRPAIFWTDRGQEGGGQYHIDYSPPRFIDENGNEGRLGVLPDLDENALDEQAPLSANDVINLIYTNAVGAKVQQPLNQQINWNGNTFDDDDFFDEPFQQVNIDVSEEESGLPADCDQYDCDDDGVDDCPNDLQVLQGHDDWSTISLPFRHFTNTADSPGNDPHESIDPTDAQIAQIVAALNTTDLKIEKSDSIDPSIAGETLTYALTVTNNGPNRTSGARIIDTLPAGVTFVSASAGCNETAPGTVECDVGAIEKGESVDVQITVLVDSGLVQVAGESPVTIENTATVENLGGDETNEANNQATEQTDVVAVADLSIDKSDATDPAAAGNELMYTITVENAGPSAAGGVTVVDTLPAGTTYVSDSDSCVDAPAGTLTCDAGDIAPGGSVSFDVTVLIDASLVFDAGGPVTITNEATVESSLADDPVTDNNETSEDTEVVASADLEIVSFAAVDPPVEIILGENVDITLRKVVTNNGPSAPVDALLTRSASAGGGASVTPLESQENILALDAGEERTVDEVFTIRCDEPGTYTFEFDNEIEPLNPDDSDPDSTNNTAQATAVVECVVPVAINILPGGEPNPVISTRSGNIPVSVLTTSTGEYGLPYAFDATSIIPDSVYFGPGPVVMQGGGAPVFQGKGNIEDSYELDQSTRDGDLDILLRFRVAETGLEPGDDEACAYGEWVTASGAVFTFFGCGPVRAH